MRWISQYLWSLLKESLMIDKNIWNEECCSSGIAWIVRVWPNSKRIWSHMNILSIWGAEGVNGIYDYKVCRITIKQESTGWHVLAFADTMLDMNHVLSYKRTTYPRSLISAFVVRCQDSIYVQRKVRIGTIPGNCPAQSGNFHFVRQFRNCTGQF